MAINQVVALFAKQGDAINAAVELADANGAPVWVIYNASTRWFFIDEEPDDADWPSSWQEIALIEPTEAR